MKDFGHVSWLAVILVLSACARSHSQDGPRTRDHQATERSSISPVSATQSAGENQVSISVQNGIRRIETNGIPDHPVGTFPNRGNPHAIKKQNRVYQTNATPARSAQITPLEFGWIFGVGVNGVPFDPLAAEFWRGDRSSAWNYDALSGAVTLGVDTNLAHVQPNGTYHYHGKPNGLLEQLGWSSLEQSPLIGWAADGFPIYAVNGNIDGQVRKLEPSYRVKAGIRPGGDAPDGRYDGTFIADYEYVQGLGDLDQCNGAVTKSKDMPDGGYAYFLTDAFPYIPRCFVGTPDSSFRMRRR